VAAPSDPELLVLHALRLKAVAGAEVVAATTGLDAGDVDVHLKAAADEGWVRHRDGALPGWSLTPTGRAEDGRRLADELDRVGARPTVEAGYARFLELNPELLQVCTDWQLVPPPGATTAGATPPAPTPNDHADAGYDEAVLARLQQIDERAQPVCTDLGSALERFAGYGPRLTTALGRTLAGDGQWLDRPVIDSYHTVWFELHEDLLATLGRDRSQERSA